MTPIRLIGLALTLLAVVALAPRHGARHPSPALQSPGAEPRRPASPHAVDGEATGDRPEHDAASDSPRFEGARLGTVLAALEGRSRRGLDEAEHAAAEQRLAELIRTDPQARRRVLRRYRGTFDMETASILARPLAESGSSEVVAFALESAYDGRTQAERLAGLVVLDHMDSDRPEVRSGLIGLLSDNDPAIVLNALYGLENRAAETDNVTVLDAIESLTLHPDDEVRRRAYMMTASWATDPADLDAVITGLEDESLVVRIAAAHGLTISRVHASEAIPTLFDHVRDPAEDGFMRYHAGLALYRMPLDAAQFAELEGYREEMMRALGPGLAQLAPPPATPAE